MREADPQAQKAFIDLLHRICGGIRVSTRYPRQPKFPHVVVTRVGGATPNRITDAATMSVQVYAETEYEAEQVAGLIRQALRSESWKGMRLSGHRVRGVAGIRCATAVPRPRPGKPGAVSVFRPAPHIAAD